MGFPVVELLKVYPADYHTVWLAHGQNLPVTLRGVLRRAARNFRIDEVAGFALLQQTPAPAGVTG